MKRKIVKLDDYLNNVINEERRINNLIDYLQCKILEERYEADIIVAELYAKLKKMPAINILMAKLEGEENLDFYFKELLMDKILNEVILGREKKPYHISTEDDENITSREDSRENDKEDEDKIAHKENDNSDTENYNERDSYDKQDDDCNIQGDNYDIESDSEEYEDEEELHREYVEIVQTEILDNLIAKYVPKEIELIDDEKFRKRFYDSIADNDIFEMDENVRDAYFNLKKDEFKLSQYSEYGMNREYDNEMKSAAECPDIESRVIGSIKFIEKNNIYFCDYLGKYNNFTIKIISNNKKEVKQILPYIEKMIANMNEVNESISDSYYEEFKKELIKNKPKAEEEEYTARDNKTGIDSGFETVFNSCEDMSTIFEKLSYISKDSDNLLSINVWPDGKMYMIYAEIERNEQIDDISVNIGILTENIHEELAKI